MVWPLSLVRSHAPLSEQTTPGRTAVGDAQGQAHLTEVIPHPDGGTVRQPPRARVVGMHLERRRGVAGRQPAEGRGDPLVGRRREEDERVGALERPVTRQPRAVLVPQIPGGELDLSRGRAWPEVAEEHGWLAADLHGQRRRGRDAAPGEAAHPRVGRVHRIVHQLGVAGAKGGLGEAEARGEPPEDLGIGERLALRRDHRLRALEPVLAVGGIEISVLEVARRGQDDIGIGEAVRHHHVGGDGEEILAGEAAAEAVLVGVDDERIVVVDEERLDRRREVGIEEVAPHVHDIEDAGARGRQVGALQARGRLGEGLAAAVDEAASRQPPLARERGQGEDGAAAAAAVLIPLQPVAHADRGGRQRVVPLGELADLGLGHVADRGRPGGRITPGLVHEGLEALDVRLDEGAIEAAAPLELRRERPGEDDVGARPEGQVQIGVLGELHALRIHHHEPGPLPARLVDDGGEVEVAPRHVVAPDYDEPRVARRLGPDPGHRPIGAHPCLAAHAPAEGLPVEEGGAQAVEEAQVHGPAREQAVRARVVQGQDGLRSVRGDDAR